VETQAGTVFGTPRYMSPEQAQGKPLDARSDLYSLGVVLYHMMTGRPPFTDDDAIVVMARHIKTVPRTLNEVAPEARIPPEVEALVMRVLSKDPDKRPDNAEALIAELTRAKESAVVTSGVRPSLAAGPVEEVLDAPPAGLPATVPPVPFSNDTLSGPAGLPTAASRWLAPAVALLLLGVAALGLLTFQRYRATAPLPAAVHVPVATVTAPILPPPAPQAPSVASAPPVSTIPSIAATALPKSDPVPLAPESRPSRRGGRPVGTATQPSHPAGSSSVGYGYLE